MAKRNGCIKCGRSIDELARACPYCNWWQSQPLPAKLERPPAVDYVPPSDNRARNKLIGIMGFGVLLPGALVGSVQQWRFRPAMMNGVPVASRFAVAVTFQP